MTLFIVRVLDMFDMAYHFGLLSLFYVLPMVNFHLHYTTSLQCIDMLHDR
jgi:hypothetical protein